MDCHGQEQAETRTPWCVLEELAGCLGTSLQLSAIHRVRPETPKDHSDISVVCAALSTESS